MTKWCKGLCWWITWKRPSATTACIVRFGWRVLLVLCVNIIHKIITVLYFSVDFQMNIHEIPKILQNYTMTITHKRRTQFLNIKLHVLILLKNPCKPNILKNVNNKRSDKTVEWFVFIISWLITFLNFFHLIPIESVSSFLL